MIENLHGEDRRPGPGDSATSVSRVRSVKRRTKGYVVLDTTWARRLGVRRSGGIYRIARWQLMERLQQLQQAPVERVLSESAVQGGDLTANEPPLEDIVARGHPHFVEFYETEAFLVDWRLPGPLNHTCSAPDETTPCCEASPPSYPTCAL